jgi:hypothetical protein
VKDLPALIRLCELEEIAACFVFNREGKILGSAVPANYSETMLLQVTLVLKQVINTVEKAKVLMREARFSFEAYGVWLKVFGDDQILAIFIQPGASPALLRQPVNLALVNLEKALNRRDSVEPVSEVAAMLAAAAHEAELQMLKVSGEDVNEVFEKLVILSEFFFGPVAVEILEHGLRDLQMSLPLTEGKQMRDLVQHASRLIGPPEIKKMYLDFTDSLIESLELQIESKKPPKKKK